MAVTVVLAHPKPNGTRLVREHADATGWHIDDHHHLHVKADKGNVASYAAGVWESVSKDGVTAAQDA